MTNSKIKANAKKQHFRKSNQNADFQSQPKQKYLVELKWQDADPFFLIKNVTVQEYEKHVTFVKTCESIIHVDFIKCMIEYEQLKSLNSSRPTFLCTYKVMLTNLLCNCTLFINNTKSDLKHFNEDLYKLFVKETQSWYDTNVNYKICCELRNLLVHGKNCVSVEDNNYVFVKSKILSDEKCMKKFGQYLNETNNDTFNVMTVIDSYMSNIIDLQKFKFDKCMVKNKDYIYNFESHFGNIEDHYGEYDGQNIYIHMGLYRKIAFMLKHGFDVSLLLSQFNISIRIEPNDCNPLSVTYNMIYDIIDDRSKNKFVYTDELFVERLNGGINNLCNVAYNNAQFVEKKVEKSQFLIDYNNNEDVKFSHKLRKKQQPLIISYKLTDTEPSITMEFNDIKYKDRDVKEYLDTLCKLNTNLLLDTQIVLT